MSLNRFEVLIPLEVSGADISFALEELDFITNLDGEYGVVFGEDDLISLNSPSNWDPDNFAINIIGQASFSSTDNEEHILFKALGDSDNYIIISKKSDNDILGRVRYHGKNYDATLTYPFSNGDTIFVGLRLNGIDSQLTLYADINDDGTLETAQSSEKVGHFYPKKNASGRLVLDTDDQGLRWVKQASGRVVLEDGSPASGLVALLQRNGRMKFAEPA